jgi:hypothetical protein
MNDPPLSRAWAGACGAEKAKVEAVSDGDSSEDRAEQGCVCM